MKIKRLSNGKIAIIKFDNTDSTDKIEMVNRLAHLERMKWNGKIVLVPILDEGSLDFIKEQFTTLQITLDLASREECEKIGFMLNEEDRFLILCTQVRKYREKMSPKARQLQELLANGTTLYELEKFLS